MKLRHILEKTRLGKAAGKTKVKMIFRSPYETLSRPKHAVEEKFDHDKLVKYFKENPDVAALLSKIIFK